MKDLVPEPNYDESKVGQYSLPQTLLSHSGKKVNDQNAWSSRRLELLGQFSEFVYGYTPEIDYSLEFEEISCKYDAIKGLATRREISLTPLRNNKSFVINLLIYTPNNAPLPVPTFLGCNYRGNQSIENCSEIQISKRWMRNTDDGVGIKNNQATEASRGSDQQSWPVETIISRGYGLATFYYGDVEADHVEGWRERIRGLTLPSQDSAFFAPNSWGAICAWAWGLSRALDFLEIDKSVAKEAVALVGHSRLGKAALWAAAQDERFAMVIANNSGKGGASLVRRNFGESINDLNLGFPHWFAGNYKNFNQNPSQLPVDSHDLLSLIAPRPIYIASAEDDLWADPKGEFLGALGADPVYSMFGKVGLGTTICPSIHSPVGSYIRYHIRSGGHGVTKYDWQEFLNFADHHLLNEQ